MAQCCGFRRQNGDVKPALLGSTCGDKQGDKLGDRAEDKQPSPLYTMLPALLLSGSLCSVRWSE